jgi:3-phosphoshikimate 1-carboxyvinyltransferase
MPISAGVMSCVAPARADSFFVDRPCRSPDAAKTMFRVSGEFSVPGDKSISHRALMMAAAALGRSRLRGVLPGGDCQSTAAVLRALGCEVPPLDRSGAELIVAGGGFGAWHSPAGPLDCGNSGTTARLMMGLLAGRPLCATLTGDQSLCSRPMRRITDPLTRMGARFRAADLDRLPLEVCGGALSSVHHQSPKASAQIKSAVLLAGVSGGVPVVVREPTRSRDHTERMLRGMGVVVAERASEQGWEVALTPPDAPLPPLDVTVPGDPSSAAFLIALGLLADEGEILIRGVGVNPTRTGLFAAVRRMGGSVAVLDERSEGGEPVADLLVRAADLHGAGVGGDEIPGLIDEVPILAALAARAAGETRVTGADELRAKESDRIALIVRNLRVLGVEAEELRDGFVIRGTDAPLKGRVQTAGDHRIAMAFGVLGALPGNMIDIDEPAAADVSFPGFWNLLRQTAKTHSFSPVQPGTGASGRNGIIVAIDGPAGSGKSSTARGVARLLGYRHLDSGALYRGLTWAALEAEIPPEQWESLTPDELERLQIRAEPAPDGFRVTVAGREVSDEIRSREVNAHVSRMAAVPAVRDWLLSALRTAGAEGGLVADGRDIGTVVFPGAELKIFLVCSPEERAARRLLEQGQAKLTPEKIQEEAARLLQRDELDSTRAVAPLLRAPDAIQLDTTGLAFDVQVAAVVRLARARIGA